jgi:hypothetical protein
MGRGVIAQTQYDNNILFFCVSDISFIFIFHVLTASYLALLSHVHSYTGCPRVLQFAVDTIFDQSYTKKNARTLVTAIYNMCISCIFLSQLAMIEKRLA